MSNFHTVTEEESPSDEKMDTRSESLRSEDTPNSTLSSDFEDRDDQNTSNLVLRLSQPETNVNMKTITSKLKKDFNDSLISKMSNLNINSPDVRPKNLGISPPKFSSTLTLTTNHPLMGLGSPDANFPDIIPKNSNQDDKDLSLSSIEDDRPNETNGFDMYSPHCNTSKNNLYFSELFTTADSVLSDSPIPPDVAKVNHQRRKIMPQLETPKKDTSTAQRVLSLKTDGNSALRQDLFAQSTPKVNGALNIPEQEDVHSGVAEWCESPSHLRLMPNFELPIEMSSNIALTKDLDSPDVVSSSTQGDKSAYQALLDPYTGSVALRPRASNSPETSRRKIQLPPEEDACSLDSVSECSMESEGLPAEEMEAGGDASNRDDVKRSASSNTVSECSDSIAPYSLADELREERSWVTVTRGDGGTAVCDMKVIEPYKRVLSHGGYDSLGAAIIVFSACHLPDATRTDYRYVMDNLFLYVIWTLERLVTDEYVLVYLHGSASRRKLPTFTWLHECYKLIDKRLRKSLKHLYLVHPTFWLKSFVIITKPFVSTKFFRKLSYVRSLSDLMDRVPVEPNAIPELVKKYDETR